MLYWAITFFMLSTIAGMLGFTGTATSEADTAKSVFFVFATMLLFSLVFPQFRRPGAWERFFEKSFFEKLFVETTNKKEKHHGTNQTYNPRH